MKTLRVHLALTLLAGSLTFAQAPMPVAATAADAVAVTRTPEELEQLLGPIALYPDALIALILPAATAPADIVLAARHLREFPTDRSQIEHRAWDESVKSLTNYPDVLKWMDENLDWTKQVGEAFASQSADVMQAIQRLRAQARAVGTLVDTPQQQVIAEPEAIRIVPAQPDVIYVPYYQPEVVFVDRPVYYSQPFLTFGLGMPVGSWLAFECDWHHRTIWVGNRHRPWIGQDWRRPLIPHGPTYAGPNFARTEVRQWRPPPVAARASVTIVHRTSSPVVRPNPYHTPSHGYAPRAAVAEMNRDAAAQPQTTTSQPRVVAPAGHRTFSGRQASPTPAATPTVVAPTPAYAPGFATAPTPPPAAQTTVTPPVQRRSGTEWSRDAQNRGEGYAHSRGNRTPSSPAVVTSPQVVTAPVAQPTPAVVSPPPRTYSNRTHVAPAPNVAVAAPAPRHSAAMAAQPAAAPAPAPTPQAAPAAQPQPAPATSAPPPSSGGHRGSRRNAQEN